jgi:hypothetical protein
MGDPATNRHQEQFFSFRSMRVDWLSKRKHYAGIIPRYS